jgi:tRNA modification GTPase
MRPSEKSTGELGENCRAAILTPAGRGAIATVAVTGARALAVVEPFFLAHSGRRLGSYPPASVVVGLWQGEAGHGEEVVVACREAERVDVHCHGGSAACQAILRRLTSAGATVQGAEEWLDEQPLDPIQREAWRALADARTERAAGILLDQWRGALGIAVANIASRLLEQSAKQDDAIEHLDRLLRWSEFGLHLTVPWRVVLAGRPNVGKSSLINALLGYQRSIVFDQPGTTRDLLTAITAWDGWSVELMDTAGCRESADPLEVEGSRRAIQELAEADLAIVVVDARESPADLVESLPSAARPTIVVANKTDLYSPELEVPSSWLRTNALAGTGINELGKAIVDRLVPVAPAAGAAIPFTARQVDGLRRARASLASGHVPDARRWLASLV